MSFIDYDYVLGEEKIKIVRKQGSALVIFLVVLSLVMILYGIGYLIISQVENIIIELPEIYRKLQISIDKIGSKYSRIYKNMPYFLQKYCDELQQNITSTEISIQIDIYGPDSADIAQQFEILFRDYIAADFFPRNIAPLYCENFRQIAMQDTEKQYNQRWTTTAKFNILPETITKIEFIHDISTYLFPLN